MEKIRQGNKKCRGAWCVLLHELGPGIARSLVWFFFSFVSTFFGVERGGLVVLVFLIYIPDLTSTVPQVW